MLDCGRDDTIRAIVLERSNITAEWLSVTRAAATGNWGNSPGLTQCTSSHGCALLSLRRVHCVNAFLSLRRVHCVCLPVTAGTKDESAMEIYFVFACVWGFGGGFGITSGTDYRKKFSGYWKDTFKTRAHTVPALPVHSVLSAH